MKKLFCKILIILIFALLFVVGLEYLTINEKTKDKMADITNSDDFLEGGSGYNSIGPIVDRARTEDKSRVLVLGDSIAGQMYRDIGDDSERVTVACSNAAIGISGQYMIMMAYLDAHPDAEDVWIFMHPLTIVRTYDLTLGYDYGVVPFARSGLIDYLDKDQKKKMASVYGRIFMNDNVATLIDSSPMNRKLYLSYVRMNRAEYIQSSPFELSSYFILKMKDECEKRGVNFHFYPSPSSEFFRERNEDLRESYNASGLYGVFPDYYEHLYYFPTEWTADGDTSHFGPDYRTREIFDMITEAVYPDFYEYLMELRQDA